MEKKSYFVHPYQRVYKAKEILFHKRLRIVRDITTPSIDDKGALSTANPRVSLLAYI